MTPKRNFLKKIVNRETVLYGVVGIGTSFLNIILFQILSLKLDYRYANFITLIAVKLAAYICNKNIVFQSHTADFKGLAAEFIRFIIARGATMLIDYFGLILMVEFWELQKLPSKCFVTVLVIVINYFIGKKHVFKNCPERQGEV